MTNVSEEIVVEWLQRVRQEYVMKNLRFKVPYGWAEIDIFTTDGKGNFTDYEVKWRSAAKIGVTERETFEKLVDNYNREERIQLIKSLIGSKSYNRVFLTTQKFLREGDKEEFAKKGIEVVFFEQVLKELIGTVESSGVYDTVVLQVIRMLKYFDLLKP